MNRITVAELGATHPTTHCSGLAAQRSLYHELSVRLAAEWERSALKKQAGLEGA
jgi:hypothetical protein